MLHIVSSVHRMCFTIVDKGSFLLIEVTPTTMYELSSGTLIGTLCQYSQIQTTSSNTSPLYELYLQFLSYVTLAHLPLHPIVIIFGHCDKVAAKEDSFHTINPGWFERCKKGFIKQPCQTWTKALPGGFLWLPQWRERQMCHLLPTQFDQVKTENKHI